MNKQQEPRLRFKGFTGEWKNKTLGDLGRVEMCRRIFKEQTQPSGEIPFFKIGTFGQEPDAFISSELFEEYRQKYPYPKQGDILISAAGTIGRTVEFTGENAYFQDSNIVWLRFDESQITSTFLNITYQNIKWGLEGSTIKRLYNSDLLSAEITLPSFPEQTHLGLFFRRLDSQIAASRAVLEKSRQLKKAMLAKMFPANGEKIPKIRFKGFEGEWERKTLGEVADIVRGASPRPIQDPKWFDEKSDIGWLRIADVTAQNGRIHYLEQKISKAGQENTRVLEEPHLLLSIAASVGKPVINYVKTGVHDGFLIFRNPDFELEFMYQYLDSFVESWQRYGQPGTQVNLNSDIVKNAEFFIPPTKSEQTQIGNFFRQLDETIALQSAEVEKLNQLKKGLLAVMLV